MGKFLLSSPFTVNACTGKIPHFKVLQMHISWLIMSRRLMSIFMYFQKLHSKIKGNSRKTNPQVACPYMLLSKVME